MDNILSQNELILIFLSASILLLVLFIVQITAVFITNKRLSILKQAMLKPNIDFIEKISEKFFPSINEIGTINKKATQSISELIFDVKKLLLEILKIQSRNAEAPERVQSILGELKEIISTSEKQSEIKTMMESLDRTQNEILKIQSRNAEAPERVQSILGELKEIISTSEKQSEIFNHIEGIKNTLSEIVELETL